MRLMKTIEKKKTASAPMIRPVRRLFGFFGSDMAFTYKFSSAGAPQAARAAG